MAGVDGAPEGVMHPVSLCVGRFNLSLSSLHSALIHPPAPKAETSAANRPAVGGALQWLRSLQHTAQNMVSGRSDDAMEDPAYLKVLGWI